MTAAQSAFGLPYSLRLIELAANAPRRGRLAAPHGAAQRRSRVCGSWVSIELQVDAQGRVADFAHEAQACVIGQAAAALVAASVIGCGRVEVEAGLAGLVGYLKGSAPVCEGWPELSALEPVKAFPARHAATLLGFEATLRALDEALNAQASLFFFDAQPGHSS